MRQEQNGLFANNERQCAQSETLQRFEHEALALQTVKMGKIEYGLILRIAVGMTCIRSRMGMHDNYPVHQMRMGKVDNSTPVDGEKEQE